jgi:copper chaperone CopZ
MSTSTYTVTGMTCDHCAGSVQQEVSKVPGVAKVDVNIATGQLEVMSDTPVASDAVRMAVEQAGYSLVAD